MIVRRLPPPDRLVQVGQQNPVCYLTDDGTPLSGVLAERLMDQGWQVVVLQWPDEVLPVRDGLDSNQQCIKVSRISEDGVQAALDLARNKAGPAAALIHLHPLLSAGQQVNQKETYQQEKILQGVFWLAKYLKPVLTGPSEDMRSTFMTVARLDGCLGTSGEGEWSEITGGLFGLVKTLSLEWNTVFCRALDVHPGLITDQAADRILAEMQDPDRLLVEVGITLQQRITLALAEPAASRRNPS